MTVLMEAVACETAPASPRTFTARSATTFARTRTKWSRIGGSTTKQILSACLGSAKLPAPSPVSMTWLWRRPSPRHRHHRSSSSSSRRTQATPRMEWIASSVITAANKPIITAWSVTASSSIARSWLATATRVNPSDGRVRFRFIDAFSFIKRFSAVAGPPPFNG